MVAVAEVREALLSILADPAERNALFGGSQNGALDDRLSSLEGQIGAMMQDRSLGGIMGGAQWISGISVVNGTITASKLSVTELAAVTANTGTLNVTGIFTAAAAFPATGARVEISSSGIWGYSGAVDTTFKFNVDGSGSIGSGATQITWTTGGVVTVPVATIGSLTIAAVGGGVLGGTYQTATTGAHINLSTTGIEAYNATSEIAANRTFQLLAATGAMTATGSFTIQSAASGTRVVVSSAGGIEGYNGTTQTFLLNAATGAGQLGPTTGGNYISWSSTGVTIGGVAMSGGKIVASALSVSTLDALSANLGTVTAGTLTAVTITSSATITAAAITTGTLTAARISGGELAGGYTLGAADITVNSTGKIKFGTSSADYLANDILHFDVATSETGVVEFRTGATTTYYGQLLGMSNAAGTAASMVMKAFGVSGARYAEVRAKVTNADATTYVEGIAAKSTGVPGASYSFFADGAHSWAVDNGVTAMTLSRTNRALALSGLLYPGLGAMGSQSTGYFDYTTTGPYGRWNGANFQFSHKVYPGDAGLQADMYLSGNAGAGLILRNTRTGSGVDARIRMQLGAAAGAEYWEVIDHAGQHQFGIDSNGNLMTVQNDTGALGTYYGRLVISVDQGGTPTSKYIPLYNVP